MTDRSIVETVECEDARKFLEALDPTGEHVGSSNSRWAFRGVGSESHALVPSALRPENQALLHLLAGTDRQGQQELAVIQVIAETWLLKRFFRLADRCGLQLPEGAGEARAVFDRVYGTPMSFIEEHGNRWPPRPLLPVLGLAQHHGLPTRMLDWTWNADIAAYFAATSLATTLRRHASARRIPGIEHETEPVDDVREPLPEDKVVVWGLDAAQLEVVSRARGQTTPIGARVVSAPGHGNPNLRAQEGVFTVWIEDMADPIVPINRSSLDERLANALDDDSAVDPGTVLRRFTLPVEHAWELLSLLDRRGVNRARLFPGFAGVAGTLLEQVHPWALSDFGEVKSFGDLLCDLGEKHLRNEDWDSADGSLSRAMACSSEETEAYARAKRGLKAAREKQGGG